MKIIFLDRRQINKIYIFSQRDKCHTSKKKQSKIPKYSFYKVLKMGPLSYPQVITHRTKEQVYYCIFKNQRFHIIKKILQSQ